MKLTVPKPIRPQIRFDTRTTVYEGQKINMYGYDAGVLVSSKLRLTLGYYRINDELPNTRKIEGVENKTHFDLQCGTINTELIYFHRRFVTIGFPLEFGVGEFKVRNTTVDSLQIESNVNGIVAFTNFGMALTYTPIRWLGLKGILGYRKPVFTSNKDFDFGGIFTSIGLNVDMQEIIKDFKMQKLKKRYYGRSYRRLPGFVDIITD
ncbi:MAG: hypothetical protein M3R27_08320 [Bacteroidota bacterium]|nr:hypothetical protein [Bacteroidota bacterium]